MPEVVEQPPASKLQKLQQRIWSYRNHRALWVLMDQGIVSAGNFFTGNQLGRRLTESGYGNYGLLLESMLYFNGLQAALVIYPLTIKGATGDRDNLGRMATAAFIFSLLLLPVLALAMGFSSMKAAQSWPIALTAISAMFLWQVQETTRRGLMSDMRFRDAIPGDFISYPGQAILIFLLHYKTSITLEKAFVIMSFTSLVAIVIQSIQIGLKSVQFHQLKSIAVEFWHLGKWILLSNGGALVSQLGYWWTLRIYWGADACGIFNAIVQLFKPVNPIISSMTGLIVPAVARVMASNGIKASTRTAIRYIAFGAVLISPYALLLALFPGTLLGFFYTPDKPYHQYGNLLRLFVANYTIVYFSNVVAAWLSGLGKSKHNFHVQLVNVIAALLVGLPCTALFGVSGLILGGLFAAACSAVAAAYFIHREAYKLAHLH